jgi:hypothetical protein
VTSRSSQIVAGAVLVLGLSACAGTPTSPPAAVPASQTSATPAATVVAPAVAAAAKPAAGKADDPFPGYSPRKGRNGQVLYCREDSVAGTRIPKLVCSTAETLRDQSAESKQQVDDIRQAAGTGGCNPAVGC